LAKLWINFHEIFGRVSRGGTRNKKWSIIVWGDPDLNQGICLTLTLENKQVHANSHV